MSDQGKECDISQIPRKGRGAISNATGRYESRVHEKVDDGWPSLDEDPPVLRTTLGTDTARRVISRNQSPDVPFDQSINPYRGCEHGCSYCFARPTHAYLGLSPGLDFESRLFHKPDAPARLLEELGEKRYVCSPIALGINTDAYQPVERRLGLTRQILEVLWSHLHPVSIVTKSALVERDVDLLAAMAGKQLAQVFVSITTLDPGLARSLEPRAPTPARRLSVIRRLAAEGIPCGVLIAPVIPALNDHELEDILAAAAKAGALTAGYAMLRLPLEVKPIFTEWLDAHASGRKEHVMSLLRQMHGGREYEAAFGVRMHGRGPYASLMAQRFKMAARREKLDQKLPSLNCRDFTPPRLNREQLELF
ncbi:PA0069 family radical SAM protein [Acidihalobacter prosperus]